jgi:hypothetical protein
MRLDELDCSSQDFARTLVVVLDVETVMAGGMIDHFDREVFCKRELNESIDSVI